MNNECIDTSNNYDLQIFEFIKSLENKNNVDNIPIPTDLRVSTRSAICKINSPLILELVGSVIYNNINKNIIEGHNPDYLILGVFMDGIELNTHVNKKKKKKKTINNQENLYKKKKNKINFFNQCSVIVKPSKDRRPVNIKLFLNGSTSMTGCLENEDGRDAINVLLNELKQYKHIFVNESDIQKLGIYDYEISMINSDYSVQFKIDRLKLYNILISQTDLLVTYEPERYPGVKISYFYNILNKHKNGICNCCDDIKCKGKGKSDTCKKITISIFQSGSIIITGSRSMVQTREAYKYINEILTTNYSMIVKFSILDHIVEEKEKEKEKVTKKTIKIKIKK